MLEYQSAQNQAQMLLRFQVASHLDQVPQLVKEPNLNLEEELPKEVEEEIPKEMEEELPKEMKEELPKEMEEDHQCRAI